MAKDQDSKEIMRVQSIFRLRKREAGIVENKEKNRVHPAEPASSNSSVSHANGFE